MAATEFYLLCSWYFRCVVAQGHGKPVSNYYITQIFICVCVYIYIYMDSQKRVYV